MPSRSSASSTKSGGARRRHAPNAAANDIELSDAEMQEARRQAELLKKRRAMVEKLGSETSAAQEEAVIEAEVERVVGRFGLLRRVLVEVGTTTVVLLASMIIVALLLQSGAKVSDTLINRQVSAASTPSQLAVDTWYARRYSSYNLLRITVEQGIFEAGDFFMFSQLVFGSWLTDSSVVSVNMYTVTTEDNKYFGFIDAAGTMLALRRNDTEGVTRFQTTSFGTSTGDLSNETRWNAVPDAVLPVFVASDPASYAFIASQSVVIPEATPWVLAANQTRAPLNSLAELDYDLTNSVLVWSPAVRNGDFDVMQLMFRSDFSVEIEIGGEKQRVPVTPYCFVETFNIASLSTTLAEHNTLKVQVNSKETNNNLTSVALVNKGSGDLIAHPEPSKAVHDDNPLVRAKLWELDGFDELNNETLASVTDAPVRVNSADGETAFVLTPLKTYSDSIIVVRTVIEDVVPEEVTQLRLLIIISLFIIVLMLMRIVFSIYVVIREYNLLLQVVRAGVETKRAEMQALDLAEKEAASNAAKSRFVSVMSHELRTPLTGVVMNTDMLQATEMDEQQSSYVSGIAESSSMLLSILNDVLDLTKLEARKVQLERRPCSFRALVEGQVHAHMAAAYAKDIEIFSFVPLTVPSAVLCDEHRLRQVISNLLSNAIKFTKEGCVSVQVLYKGTFEAEDGGGVLDGGSPRATSAAAAAGALRSPRGGAAGGGGGGDDGAKSPRRQGRMAVARANSRTRMKHKLRVEVIDTGAGIDDDGMQRLFKEFSQVDQSTTREYGGTGLGLFVCKEIVQLMGGEIGVKSELGVGSTFWFELDVHEACGDDYVGTDIKPIVALRAFETPSQPLHVCIASDDPAMRKLLVRYVYELFPDAKASHDAGEESVNVAIREASNATKVLKWLKERDTHKNVQMDGSLWVLICSDTMESEKLGKALGEHSTHKKQDFFVLLTPEVSKKAGAALLSQGWSHTLVRPVRLHRMHNLFAKVVGDTQAHADGTHSPSSSNPQSESTRRLSLAGGSSQTTSDVDGGGGSGDVKQEGDRPTVLIVDDFLMMRDLMTKALQNLGFATRTAANGKVAVETFMHKKFAFILMDCEMPVMDGYEATKQIRELEAKSNMKRTPVIACTANAMREDRHKTMDAGMDDILAKPVSNDALKAIVKKYGKVENK